MTDCKSDYAGLAQYNNGIAFKPWNRPHTYNRANPPVLSTLKNNVYGRMNTSGYHTLKDGYVSYPTNCTNVTIPSLVTKEKYTRENFDSKSKYYCHTQRENYDSESQSSSPSECKGNCWDWHSCPPHCQCIPIPGRAGKCMPSPMPPPAPRHNKCKPGAGGTCAPPVCPKCCSQYITPGNDCSTCVNTLCKKQTLPRPPRTPKLDTRENYNNINKPKVVVLSADHWCGYSKTMTAQEDEIKQKLEKAGFSVEFVNGSQNKSKLDTLAKKHGVTGFPTTLVHNRRGETHKISGMMKADQLVKKCKNKTKRPRGPPGSY
jgi:hypothetical protein